MKYFDYAASCPLDQEAAEVYVQAATAHYGNASSLHDKGEQADTLLALSRGKIADCLGVAPESIFFTGSGSEGNYLAIRALLSGSARQHVITGAAEHASVQQTMEKLRMEGYKVTELPFNSEGKIEVEKLIAAIRPDTALVNIQHANPEIGTLQPIEDISAVCREKGVLVHSDCVQSFGKTDVTGVARHVDSLTVSGHKFYGPKGVGAVYIRPSVKWHSYYPGTTHEGGFRPGTVNVPGAAAMAAAAEKAVRLLHRLEDHYTLLNNEFRTAITSISGRCTIYPSDLPSTIGMRLHGAEGQYVMLEANRRGYAISTGSACAVSMQAPSVTMRAMGVEDKTAKEFVRITFGRETTVEDVRGLADTLRDIAAEFG